MYVVFRFLCINESSAPREKPGDCLVACTIYFVPFIYYFMSASREGTRGLPDSYLIFYCVHAGKVPNPILKVKVMYVM